MSSVNKHGLGRGLGALLGDDDLNLDLEFLDDEKQLVKNESLPNVTLFKAAHHGSNGSNSTEILEALNPVPDTEINVFIIILGIIALKFVGDFVVDNAEKIALAFNISEKIKCTKDNIRPKAFSEVLDKLKGTEYEKVISTLILRFFSAICFSNSAAVFLAPVAIPQLPCPTTTLMLSPPMLFL